MKVEGDDEGRDIFQVERDVEGMKGEDGPSLEDFVLNR